MQHERYVEAEATKADMVVLQEQRSVLHAKLEPAHVAVAPPPVDADSHLLVALGLLSAAHKAAVFPMTPAGSPHVEELVLPGIQVCACVCVRCDCFRYMWCSLSLCFSMCTVCFLNFAFRMQARQSARQR